MKLLIDAVKCTLLASSKGVEGVSLDINYRVSKISIYHSDSVTHRPIKSFSTYFDHMSNHENKKNGHYAAHNFIKEVKEYLLKLSKNEEETTS